VDLIKEERRRGCGARLSQHYQPYYCYCYTLIATTTPATTANATSTTTAAATSTYTSIHTKQPSSPLLHKLLSPHLRTINPKRHKEVRPWFLGDVLDRCGGGGCYRCCQFCTERAQVMKQGDECVDGGSDDDNDDDDDDDDDDDEQW